MAQPKKILVIEDTPDMLLAITMRLQAHGFEVITASDGQQALSQAKSKMPDLIISDLMLPLLNGHHICRILKSKRAYRDIPIIIFSAREGDIDKQMAMKQGADAYIVKGTDFEILRAKIDELLARPKL